MMNSQQRTRKFVPGAVLIFAGWMILSCSFSIPFLSSTAAAGGEGGILPDPAAGLADLAAYHASLKQDVTGTVNGAPFERHTKLEITREPAKASYDFSLTLSGSAEPSTFLRILALGPASYVWGKPEGNCQGEYDDLTAAKMIDPTAMLSPVTKGTKAGSENVNGIPSTRYTFDQTGIAWPDPKPKISGEVWVADTGGFAVKYTLTVTAPSAPDPMGAQVGQTWEYEVSGTDGSVAVALPQGCIEVLTDIPVMPDAQSLLRENGITEFVTASNARQVVDFYGQQLPLVGWQIEAEPPNGGIALPFTTYFRNGDKRIMLRLRAAQPSGVDVAILLAVGTGVTPNATAEPGAQATPTPGIVPTVGKSESGLPEDVPLYPGASDLFSPAAGTVQFKTNDTPDAVDKWYQQQMPPNGWKLMSRTTQANNIIQLWTKDKRVTSVTIIPQGEKTLVMIAFVNG
jgi:hypothetical protein